MSPVSMGKLTAAKFPLAVVSPNEPVYGTRSKSQGTSIFGSYQGKENTTVRSVRTGVHNAADEPRLETSRSSNERQQLFASQKRTRSSALTDPSLRSGLCGEGKDPREEDSLAGSQTDSPVRVDNGKDFLPDDYNIGNNLQNTATPDACSPSDDGIQSGAPVGTAVKHDPDFSGRSKEEMLVVFCSDEQNMGSDEVAAVAGSKASVVPAGQSSFEESRRKLRSDKKRSPTKTYTRRKASRGTISPSAPNPQDVLGTSRDIETRTSRDKNDCINFTEFVKSDQLQTGVARATDALQSAYDKLFKKYQNLKSRQLADAEEAFDEQASRIEVFSRAADNLVEELRTSHSVWEYQEEMISRSRLMEAAYIECQNELVNERARNLELRQRPENSEVRGSTLLHNLLENTTQLTISNFGKSEITFSHNQSGYEFKLEQNELSEKVWGKDALLYKVVSPGTILHAAPDWMQSETVFDKAQAPVFFRRIQALCNGGSVTDYARLLKHLDLV